MHSVSTEARPQRAQRVRRSCINGVCSDDAIRVNIDDVMDKLTQLEQEDSRLSNETELLKTREKHIKAENTKLQEKERRLELEIENLKKIDLHFRPRRPRPSEKPEDRPTQSIKY